MAGGRFVKLSGVADERLDLLPALEGATGVLILDLDELSIITSAGVRRWLLALRTFNGSYLAFLRARPALMMQFNTVHGFRGNGELLSFYLNYVCSGCGHYFEVLLDTIKSRMAIEALTPPEEHCPKCGGHADFDDDPDACFFLAASLPPPSPPSIANSMLARREHRRFRMEKVVEPTLTVLWASGFMDHSSSFKRLASGLEGTVVMRFNALTGASETGLERFTGFLASCTFPVLLSDVPLDLLPGLLRRTDWPKAVEFLSVAVSAQCGGCHQRRAFTVPAAVFIDGRGANGLPRPCPSCRRSVSLEFNPVEREALGAARWAKPSLQLQQYLHRNDRPPSVSTTTGIGGQGLAKVGRYELLEKLGSGGMAEVFLARQTGIGGFEKKVVIKSILPHLAQTADFVEMLLMEARVAARISSPYVVQTYDVMHFAGHFYIALEYVKGRDLGALLKGAQYGDIPMPLGAAVQLMHDVARGLQAAHALVDEHGRSAPLIHRDVSTHNVLVGEDGRCKISDFGIAKAAGALTTTPVGSLKGKLAYAAPELLEDPGAPNTEQTDLYAAGVVFYECLTLKHPFRRPTLAQTTLAILQASPAALSAERPDVPEPLRRIVAKAMARNVADRYGSAIELGADLQSVAAELRNGESELASWVAAATEVLSLMPPAEDAGAAGTLQLEEPAPSTQNDRETR